MNGKEKVTDMFRTIGRVFYVIAVILILLFFLVFSTDETAAREYMALAVLSLLTGVFCLLLEDIHLRFSRGGGNLRKNNSTAICPHCGKFINRHDNCCKHCGLKINTGA